ncbi:MAG: type IV pilus assembly protein PilM [Firmicutes bacterium]|nr:type IV pilus assembly protein PilM [Bacillota bacterium]
MRLFKPSGAVGLELDTGVIRAVEVSGTLRSTALVKAGQVETPPEAVVEGVIEDVEAVAGALDKLWSKAGFGSREVVLGVSNQGVLMRLANFPKMPGDKLAKMLRYQAGEYFPIPLEELVLDYAVAGEVRGETGAHMEVLMVAARQDMLGKYLQALSAASLTPKVVDASPLALMRTLPDSRLSGTVILADISNGMSTLLLVIGGVPRVVRMMPNVPQYSVGKSDYAVGAVLEAEQQVASALAEGEPGDLWFQRGAVLASEIRSSIGYYIAQREAISVDCLFLSGRGAMVDGLPEFFGSELGVPVEIINPLAGFKEPVQARNIDWTRRGPAFAATIGLALRGLEN